MSRKLLAAILTLGVTLAVAVPAVARTHRQIRGRTHKALVMGGLLGAVHRGAARFASGGETGVVDNQGFKCTVVVGKGPSDTKYVEETTYDSVEYSVTGPSSTSVTTVCIGSLPSTAQVAPTVVSAPTTNCGQLDPARPGKYIQGGGVITTFPDHLYQASCTTPNYS